MNQDTNVDSSKHFARRQDNENIFIHSSDGVRTGKNRIKEKIGFFLLWLSSALVFLILAVTLAYIFTKGSAEAFSWNYLFTPPEGGRNDQGGVLYPLIGTIYLIVGSLVVASPIGIFGAIYLREYANPKSLLTKCSRFAIDSLAGIPSVIYGLFGLAFFVSFMGFKHSMLAGSLSVAIMILPVIIRTSEEAINSIPQSYRDASFALGANKAQTIFQVVLPNAVPGIFTGVMLSVGRAIAESAVLILAAGGSITAFPRMFSMEYPFFLPDSGRTLAVHLYYQATSYDNPDKVFATAVVLIVLVLTFNLLALLGLNLTKKQK
ncbi:MAG: phosphate ABC transporter permease PstA [Candidatus Caenarcaniphilales bacterium]|nr:phosphate ABC transporter permease PstA [Candidatus Caenarcaniphilales bacterium]